MHRRMIEALLLVTCGLLISFGVGELFLRVFHPQIFEIHPPGMYKEDPRLGYVLAPGFQGTIERSEFSCLVTVGSGGLRAWNPEPRDSGGFRILILGDSQAFGFGVADKETFAWHLQELLAARLPQRPIEVINGGVPGYGTADQLALLESAASEIQPDMIVLQFLSNNDIKENRTPAKDWAAVENGMLTAKEQEPGAAGETDSVLIRSRRWLKMHSHLGRLVSDTLGYWSARLGLLGGQASLLGEDFSEADAAFGRGLLEEVAAFGRTLPAEVIFLYTTGQANVLDQTTDLLRSRSVVAAAAQNAGVPWIDVSKEMWGRDDKLSFYYRKDGHWTPQGHQAVAEILTEFIMDHALVEPVATVHGADSARDPGLN